MIKIWIRWRILRNLVKLRGYSINIIKTFETNEKVSLDQIQKLIYDITYKLIQDASSDLRTNRIDNTYHIENENYLIIIRTQSGYYSINLIEYKDISNINNFDVPFDSSYIEVLLNSFNKEIFRRMKNRQLMRTNKVAKHLQSILNDINNK